jgi:hypothetical protein
MNQILRILGLPVKARLRLLDCWEVSDSVVGKHIVFSASRSTRGAYLEVDQRIVRGEFLDVKTPADAVKFFKRFGPFQRKNSGLNLSFTEVANDVQFAALQYYQSFFRTFIETPVPECFEPDKDAPPGKRLHQTMLHAAPRPIFTVELGHVRYKEHKHPSPYLQQYADDVLSAVYNSIYIDKMAGARGGICEKCEKVFLSYSDRPARFCSKKCGNAARQSERRKKAKLEKGDTNG